MSAVEPTTPRARQTVIDVALSCVLIAVVGFIVIGAVSMAYLWWRLLNR